MFGRTAACGADFPFGAAARDGTADTAPTAKRKMMTIGFFIGLR